MTNEIADTDEPDYPPFMSPTGVRRMTVAVVVMGVILLVGFATLVGLIIYKSGKAKKAEIARNAPAVVSADTARETYTGGSAAVRFLEQRLPKGARITHIAMDGDRLALTIEDGSGSTVMLFDAAAWELKGVLRLSEGASAGD